MKRYVFSKINDKSEIESSNPHWKSLSSVVDFAQTTQKGWTHISEITIKNNTIKKYIWTKTIEETVRYYKLYKI